MNYSVMKINVGIGLIKVAESLYEESKHAAMSNMDTDLEWFQTTSGIRQGCILSPCLFNVFLELTQKKVKCW